MNHPIRRTDRIASPTEMKRIISQAKILHLGLFDKEYPYVIPLHYGFEWDSEKERGVFYMHCALKGHKLDLIRKNPNACVEIETDVKLVSGSDVPCQYGSLYASVIARGKIYIVNEIQEKCHGLKLLMQNQTGKDFKITEEMAAKVAVLKLIVTQCSAKARTI